MTTPAHKHPIVLNVVAEIYRKPVTLASNFARAHKEEIAMAASWGLITVFYPDYVNGVFTHMTTDGTWRITSKGLQEIGEAYYESSRANECPF